jgi:uncharacterized protein (TIGR00369 family)
MPDSDTVDTRTKQPNSRQCFACGVENPVGLHLKFYETEDGEVTAEITLPGRYQGYPGVVHGGIVASMLDEVTGRAAMEGDIWRFMMTAKLDLRYRSPVPIGQPLFLVGRLVNRRGRLAMAHGEIRLADGKICAEAEALLADIPGMPGGSRDVEGLGWKVYPD